MGQDIYQFGPFPATTPARRAFIDQVKHEALIARHRKNIDDTDWPECPTCGTRVHPDYLAIHEGYWQDRERRRQRDYRRQLEHEVNDDPEFVREVHEFLDADRERQSDSEQAEHRRRRAEQHTGR